MPQLFQISSDTVSVNNQVTLSSPSNRKEREHEELEHNRKNDSHPITKSIS